MLGLFGLVGGAALEIRRLRGRGSGNDAQTRELKKAIEQYAQDLERERRAALAASRRADNMEEAAAALRQTAETLGRQREELAQQNAELLLTNLALDDHAQKLQGEANQLALVNRRLTDQLEELSAARDADAERFASDVAALRDRVADVLKRMFSNEIGDEEAVEALRELGCEVRFVPAGRQGRRGSRQEASEPSALTYVFEPPRLVLEDPARLARLMQAARSSSNASPRRLEGPTSGGNLTPRIAGGAGGAPAMQASLTMVGGSGAGGGSGSSTGVPRFVLSWLGGPADASGSGVAASAPDVVRGAAADAPAKDAAAAAVAAAPGGSPVKAAFGGKVAPASKGPAHIEPQNGTLVFSPQAKGKAGHKSRLGLSLADAAGVFKRGGTSGAQAAPSIAAPAAVRAGAADSGSDVSSSRDLVPSRK